MYNTWQFNFKFDLGYDLYAPDSVQFLQSYGIDFSRHYADGIDFSLFGELLMSSGIVLNDEVRWIAFQGKYDFGYLIKLLTCDYLPNTQEQFFELLHTYFPNIYDIKWLLHNVHHELEDQVVVVASRELSPTSASGGDVPGGGPITGGTTGRGREMGLEDLAKTLGIPRVGTAHQAGSDSLLTCQVFFRLVHRHLPHVLSQPPVGSETTTANSGPPSPTIKPEALDDEDGTTPQRRFGSRGRCSSVGSDGLIIEGRAHGNSACHLRNVLHGLGRGYIQPDRDHSQLKAAAAAASSSSVNALTSPPPPGTSAFLMGGAGPNRAAMFAPIPPPPQIAPPPLSGAIRLDANSRGLVHLGGNPQTDSFLHPPTIVHD
jgi:hypothetical protein